MDRLKVKKAESEHDYKVQMVKLLTKMRHELQQFGRMVEDISGGQFDSYDNTVAMRGMWTGASREVTECLEDFKLAKWH